MNKNLGFTFIEILVAIFVFAIVGTISILSLHSVTKIYPKIEKMNTKLQELEFASTIMHRDFTQIIDRPVLDIKGRDNLPSLMAISTHDIEFTTGNFVNPLDPNRLSIKRVAYEWDEKHKRLIRKTWPVLDRAPQTKPEKRVLLTDVTEMSLSYADGEGQFVQSWTSSKLNGFPRAIIVTLNIDAYGIWREVFPILGRGYDYNK